MKSILLVVALCSLSFAQHDCSQTSRDEFLKKVIADAREIKPGMTRGELQKSFAIAAGVQGTEHATYLYRGSRLVHIDVVFETERQRTGKGKLFSDNDVITSVSRPYLAYTRY